jgi:hypothetical protein
LSAYLTFQNFCRSIKVYRRTLAKLYSSLSYGAVIFIGFPYCVKEGVVMVTDRRTLRPFELGVEFSEIGMKIMPLCR